MDIDLRRLSTRERERVEWSDGDPEDIVRTLVAFANDLANLGGGYVVCGAREVRDEHGFQRVEIAGITAARAREVEGRVLTGCRERVTPPLTPRVTELPTDDPARRVLVFTAAAESRTSGEGRTTGAATTCASGARRGRRGTASSSSC